MNYIFNRNEAGVAIWTTQTRWVRNFPNQENYDAMINEMHGMAPDIVYKGFNSINDINFFTVCARWEYLSKGEDPTQAEQDRYEAFKGRLFKLYPLEIKKKAENKQVSNAICEGIERVYRANLEEAAREFGLLPPLRPKTSQEVYAEVIMKHPDWKVTIVDDAERLPPVGEFFILYGKLYKRAETREQQKKRLEAERKRKEIERLKQIGADFKEIRDAEFKYIEASEDE